MLVAGAFVACEATVNLGDRDAGAMGGGSVGGGGGAEGGGGAAGGGGASGGGGAMPLDDGGHDAGVDAGIDSGMLDAGFKWVFITRGTFAYNFGGLVQGDDKCQAAANAAGFTGTFKAWLSDDSTNAIDRITSNGPWREVGSQTLMFTDKANLRGYPKARLTRDELGLDAGLRWYTGTLVTGVKSSNTCQSWTNNTSMVMSGTTGIRGGSSPPGKEWTEDTAYACANSVPYHLLCLQD